MNRYKEPKPLPYIICSTIFMFILLFSTLGGAVFNDKDTTMDMLITIAVELCFGACVLGAIMGFILYTMAKPTKTTLHKIRLQEEQNMRLNEMKQNNIADELMKLEMLKKNNSITEEEFKKLKDRLINR